MKKQIRKWTKVLVGSLALFSVVVFFGGALSNAGELAPYFYTWGEGDSSYAVTSLVQAYQKAGLTTATLAFESSSSGCYLSSDVNDMLSDVKAFIAAGGRVIVSFGGASGTYIQVACSTESALYSQLNQFIKQTGIEALDFDVEGTQLSNTAANQLLVSALFQLKLTYPNLYISFTLPVDAKSGLGSDSLSLLQFAQSSGLNVDRVNIMTMDYGYTIAGKTMGDMAIMATQATLSQLSSIFTQKTTAQLEAMIGITPMIGTNDDGSTFTTADATEVTQYAIQNGIGLLSYWSFQRDQVGSGDLGLYSEVNTSDFQFYNIMLPFASATSPVTSPTPNPVPSPCPTVTCSSGVKVWSSCNTGYAPDTTVKDPNGWACYWNGYKGNNYNTGEPINGNGWTKNPSCPSNDNCTGNPLPSPLPTASATPNPCPTVTCTSGVKVWSSCNTGYAPDTTVKDPNGWACYWNGYQGNNYNTGEPINGNGWTKNPACPPNDNCSGS